MKKSWEVPVILETEKSIKEKELFGKIMGRTFILKLAYLTHYFTEIN
jgi:hypothetical protein